MHKKLMLAIAATTVAGLMALLGAPRYAQSGAASPSTLQGVWRVLGANSSVGNGTVTSYAEFDKNRAPKAIGIVFQTSALEGLPSAPSDGHHCFDRNKDGKIDLETECFATHEWVIPLPSEAARRSEIPFRGQSSGAYPS